MFFLAVPMSPVMSRIADPGPLRVGNCSGFYGDRLAAMREMLEGGELDVLTGDYLAELTMLILGRDRKNDPAAGPTMTEASVTRPVTTTSAPALRHSAMPQAPR